MGKLKTSDSKGLSKAQTAKLRRENRTDEERHVILEADCLHHQQAKERETEEHHAARLQKDALGHQEKKQKGSPDQRTVRLQRKALAQQQAKKGKLKNIMLPDYRKMLSIIKKRDKEKVQNNVLLDFRNMKMQKKRICKRRNTTCSSLLTSTFICCGQYDPRTRIVDFPTDDNLFWYFLYVKFYIDSKRSGSPMLQCADKYRKRGFQQLG
jgi:hypothetical protein